MALKLDNPLSVNTPVKLLYLLLLTPTRIAGIRRSSASVCVSVCLHDRTKTAETTITKLATGIVHHESWLPVYPFRSKGQGDRITVQKPILVEGDRVAGMSLHTIECPPSTWSCLRLIYDDDAVTGAVHGSVWHSGVWSTG